MLGKPGLVRFEHIAIPCVIAGKGGDQGSGDDNGDVVLITCTVKS